MPVTANLPISGREEDGFNQWSQLVDTHNSERKNKRDVRLCFELSWETADASLTGQGEVVAQSGESESSSENTVHD